MPTVVIVQGGDFESHYNRSLQYLDNKYHSYPSNLNDIPLTEQELCEMAAYEAYARQTCNPSISASTPIGKLVV
jgi:hypothetical protein